MDLWRFCLELDGKQHEREVELRCNRYMVAHLRQELEESRKDKRRLELAYEGASKRNRSDQLEQEVERLRRERDGLSKHLNTAKEEMITVVRERDLAQKALEKYHADRRGLRPAVRALTRSLGSDDRDLQRLERYCMN